MTDRELLELAAKAAGIEIDKSPYNGGGHGNTGFDVLGNVKLDCHSGETWNPLTDDGDALRLAVNLRIDIAISGVIAAATSYRGQCFQEYANDNLSAATRRAIVRAAAALGAQIAAQEQEKSHANSDPDPIDQAS